MNTDVVEKLERENISLASFSKRIYAYCVDEVLISILFIRHFLRGIMELALVKWLSR